METVETEETVETVESVTAVKLHQNTGLKSSRNTPKEKFLFLLGHYFVPALNCCAVETVEIVKTADTVDCID